MKGSRGILFIAILFCIACGWIIFSHEPQTASLEFIQSIDSVVGLECHDEFGIDAEGYNVIKGKIRPNQFLADILLPLNVPYN